MIKNKNLIVEHHAPGHVTLEDEVQIVQHGRVHEHKVHQGMPHHATQLKWKSMEEIDDILLSENYTSDRLR